MALNAGSVDDQSVKSNGGVIDVQRRTKKLLPKIHKLTKSDNFCYIKSSEYISQPEYIKRIYMKYIFYSQKYHSNLEKYTDAILIYKRNYHSFKFIKRVMIKLIEW